MRILYELIGPFWRLPIGVVWHAEFAEVRIGCGLALLKCQYAEAKSLLSDVGEVRGSTFWITRKRLEDVAIKSEHDDPELVVEWLPHRKSQEPVVSNYSPDPFIASFCASPYSVVRDPLIMDVIWCGLQKWMLHTLLNEQKEIDLNFAKLVPLMFRANWKHIVAKKDAQTSRPYVTNYPSIVTRLGDTLVSESLTGWDMDSKTCSWTLDVVTGEEWDNMARRLEVEKRRRRASNYYHNVNHQLRRQLPKAIELYAYYCKLASRPYVRLPQKQRRLRPGAIIQPGRGKVAAILPHPDIGADIVFNPDGEKSSITTQEAQVAPLPPELLALQQRAAQLWNAGRKIPRPEKRPVETTGMPVLDAVQSPV